MPSHRNHRSIRPQRRALIAVAVIVGVAALAIVALATAGDSSDDIAAATYDGLDPTLVAEATQNANFVNRLEEQPDETKAGLAQGMVINFEVCRQLLHAYEELVTTGSAEPLPALPKPTNPEPFSYDWWVKDHVEMSNAVLDRNVDAIRGWIAGEGSCGEWIPATGRDPETISERVAALEGSS